MKPRSITHCLRSLLVGAAFCLGLAPATVALGQTSPGYTLFPSTNLWDGRQTFTVTPVVTNMAGLGGATNFTYQWSVDGVAVIGQSLPPDINNPGIFTNAILTLLRAQGNGPMTVTLALGNGGTPVTNKCAITVQQPATDAWVVRTPGANEVPVNNQFYARDDTGYGTIYYSGTQSGSPSKVLLNVYANGVLYTNLNQIPSGGAYAFSARIAAGLVTYSVQYGYVTGGVTNWSSAVTNLVCGDAYIIEGQSNAATVDGSIGSELNVSPTIYSNQWIRSYGQLGAGTNGGWGYATRYDVEPKISYWGMDMASNLWATYKMPICIINGAVGGTMIVQHQANPANHYAANGHGDTIYANLLSRVVAAGLTHGIRGVLWHQGEQDQGLQQGLAYPDYLIYQKYFVNMTAAWKQDFPNIKNYYVFQIWPAACGDQADNDMLREVQRTLSRLYSNLHVMSTLGIVPGSGCHYVPAGYQRFSDLISPLVQQDNYRYVPANDITAPDLQQAYYSTTSKDEITLVFGQNMTWGSTALNRFFMDYVTPFSPGVNTGVKSGSVSGNVIKLKLNGASTYQTITYLAGSTWANTSAWDGVQSNLLYGSNGIAALTFCSVPITASASASLFSLPATNITTTSAVIRATLGCGGTNYAVSAYWNTVNGGTSPDGWANSGYVGTWTNVASTNLSFSINGLLTGTRYYFTFEGTNAAGPAWNLWPYNMQSFTTQVGAPGPVVDNDGGATNLDLGVSQLRGTLANGPADVYLYWGTTDGGTTPANWANAKLLANTASGSFSINISNLLYGLSYYYRCYASNQLGVAWSPITTNFTSLQPATPAGLTNAAPTGITAVSATFNAMLSCSGAAYNVTVYWGATNGGTNAAAWNNSASLGSWLNVAATNLSYSAVGLTPAANYYCTFAATNALGALWATNIQSFATPSSLGYSSATTNGNVIITFTNGSGLWTPPGGVTNVSVLVVAGGGGAGQNSGGGGGAGGVIYSNRFLVSGATRVTVGEGGVGGVNGAAAANGANSVFSTLTAIGGGRGAGGYNTVGSGGSGGGGFWAAAGGGNGTAGQGNSGGSDNATYGGAGGGGAAGVGGNSSNGGNGGNGVTNSITGSPVAYGGGGGGGADGSNGTRPAAGLGGTGGGGRSAGTVSGVESAAVAGAANTGGGGGGGDNNYSVTDNQNGAAGGSGVIIISYAASLASTVIISNSPAAGITTNQATFNGTLGCVGTNALAYAHWGTVNGGTNAAAWSNSAYVGSWTNVASTNISYTAAGLTPSTTYYFTFRGTNAGGSVWAATPQSFTTMGPPVVDNAVGAANLAPGLAQLRGTLAFGPADVRLYWGTADGGTNKANWANTLLVTGVASGGFSSNASNLLYGLTYYYRCQASNQWGVAWSPSTASFATLKPVATTVVQIPYSSLVEVSASSQYGGYPAANAFNGAGLQANDTHTTGGNWFSSGAAAVTNEWLKVRFDQPYVLDHLRVWAFNAGSVTPAVTNADVYVLNSATDPAGNVNLGGGPFKTNGWSLLLPRQYFTPSSSAATETNTDPSISLGGVTAQQLALKINNVVSGTYAGFAEVQICQSPPLLSLNNSAATGVGSGSATLNATLGCTGAVYQVYAYWNTVNGGTSAGLWTNSAYVGSWTNLGSASLSYTAMGLAPASTYYFTFCATNAVDTLWGANVQSFTTLTPPPPVVDNGAGASNLAVGVAQLRGTLANGPADARFDWGTSDGGTNFGLWTSDFGLPSVASGGFSSNVSNLLYGLTYYYRTYASNQWGTAWATATTNFTTLRPNSTLANSAATGLATNAAALHGTLACTGAVYQVTAFWNTVNGGTDAALWTNSAYVGSWTNVVSTNLSYTAAGLLPNTAYYFTFRATNALDTLWAANVQSFTTLTPPPPFVDNGTGAANLAVGVAQLRGTLANGPADVRLYWGTSDGGTTPANWAAVNPLTGVASGAFSSNVSNVLYGLTYYYRTYASNQWGTAWASAATNFTTLRPSSSLANSAASGLATNAAALHATLACTGAVYQVTAFWNTVNGGTDAALWTNSAYVGSWTNVVSTNLSYTAAGLLPNTAYYFTFRATNALDTLWGDNVQSFTTLTPPPPAVDNGAGATNLAAGVAQLRGTLANGPADVRLYWGTADGGTNFGLWTSDCGLPSVASGDFSSNVSNLLYGLTCYYRCHASNQWGTAWASATTNFTTLRPNSTLANSAATGVSSTAAGLNAALACTGAVYNVVVFWDTADDGTNAAAWANSAALGCWTNVAATNLIFSANGLAPSTAYYFTFLATNALDTLWATNVQGFTTLAATTPPIPVLPVSGVAVTNGVPSFTFSAAKGCMYRLDYKDGLTDAGWSYGDWSTNASGGDVQMTLTDLTAAGQPQRFYRLEAANP